MSFVIVSGCGSDFFGHLVALVHSVRDKSKGRGVPFCIFDMGLTDNQRDWLLVHGANVRKPEWRYQCNLSSTERLLITRPEIPDYFPGHDVYLWIDPDAWVQRWEAVETICAGAIESGFCVVPELHPSYPPYANWGITYANAWYGPPEAGTRELSLNAGVFAGRADAPHWQAWRKRVADVVERPPFDANCHFALDQAALSVIVNRDHFPCAHPSAGHNFLCNHGRPRVSEDGAVLLEPDPPYQPLGIVHNSGKDKNRLEILKTPNAKLLTRGFTYVAPSMVPKGDYVSPNFTIAFLDVCFPNMVKGDTAAVTWPHFRHGINHNWYVDKRDPLTGFINRDEAHILYNNALRFKNKHALEIGCHMGWSASYLAIAGVHLDVIDPILANPKIRESVLSSLQGCNLPGVIYLYPTKSPEAVEQIANAQNKKWSLFFIDGNHEHPGPLDDAIVCEKYAEKDATVLFHDLAAPAVAEGLSYLKKQGWQTRLYHTAQIMGAAWRGDVTPVDHEPDPAITWNIPDHLRPFV